MKSKWVFTLIQIIMLFSFRMANAQTSFEIKVGVQVQPEKMSEFIPNAEDEIKSSSKVRFFLYSNTDCYLSIVYTKGNESALIKNEIVKKNTETFIPAMAGYKLEKMSTQHKFSVICSQKKLEPVIKLFQSKKVTRENWEKVEKTLVKGNDSSFVSHAVKNEIVGANLRGQRRRKDWDTRFIPINLAKSYFIKRFRFHVKN